MAQATLCAILIFAAAVRFANLGLASLWWDEARTYHGAKAGADLLDGLLHGGYSVGPLGMVHFRLAIVLSDATEWWLRFPSVLAGLATVWLMWVVGCRMGGYSAGTAAALIGACADGFIAYSREFRHYSMEMALTLAVIWLACRVIEAAERGEGERRAWSAYMAMGVLALLYSWVAVFTISATGAWIFAERWKHAGARDAALALALHLPLAGLFGCLFHFIAAAQMRSDTTDYYAFWSAFMYGGSNPLGFREWLGTRTVDLNSLVFGSVPPVVTGGLAVLGTVGLVRRGRPTFVIPLVGCLAIVLLAAIARKYPYGERPDMFAAGPFGVLLAVGAIELLATLGRWRLGAVGVVATGVAAVWLGGAAIEQSFRSPRIVDDMRPVYERLLSGCRDGDQVYLHCDAISMFSYYNRHGAIDVEHGTATPEPEIIAREVSELLNGSRRVWILFSRAEESDVARILRRVAAQTGCGVDEHWSQNRVDVWVLNRTGAIRTDDFAGLYAAVWVTLRPNRAVSIEMPQRPIAAARSTGDWGAIELMLVPGERAQPDDVFSLTYEIEAVEPDKVELQFLLTNAEQAEFGWETLPPGVGPERATITVRKLWDRNNQSVATSGLEFLSRADLILLRIKSTVAGQTASVQLLGAGWTSTRK